MPGATTNLALPYPLPEDPPAGETQIEDLAERIDTELFAAAMNATSSGQAVPGGDAWAYMFLTSTFKFSDGYTFEPGGFTVPADGTYLLSCVIQANDTTEGANLGFALNWDGSSAVALVGPQRRAKAGELTVDVLAFVRLKKGDRIGPVCQSAAGAMNPWSADLSIVRVGVGARTAAPAPFSPVEHRPPNTL